MWKNINRDIGYHMKINTLCTILNQKLNEIDLMKRRKLGTENFISDSSSGK